MNKNNNDYENIDLDINKITAAVELAQKLIDDLYDEDPNGNTFTQRGFLDGKQIVLDYIEHNEFGCAVMHLLYMIHESEIDFPMQIKKEVHQIAKNNNIENYFK